MLSEDDTLDFGLRTILGMKFTRGAGRGTEEMEDRVLLDSYFYWVSSLAFPIYVSMWNKPR